MAREWTGVVCWRGKEFLFYVIPVYILVGLDLVYAWPYPCSPLALPMYGYWGERGEVEEEGTFVMFLDYLL